MQLVIPHILGSKPSALGCPPQRNETAAWWETASTNLPARFKPIVVKATESTCVTAAYKNMVDKSKLSGFNRFGSLLRTSENMDVDDYVTRKAMDGLFLKISEQVKLIRDNPAARSTEILQKVFGAIKK